MCLTLFNVASLPRHLRGCGLAEWRRDLAPPSETEREEREEEETPRPGNADERMPS